MPSLLQVRLRHVKSMGETRHWNRSHTNAWTIPKQNGQCLLFTIRPLPTMFTFLPFSIVMHGHCLIFRHICRFEYCAMTVPRFQKSSFMWLPRNAWIADHTILARCRVISTFLPSGQSFQTARGPPHLCPCPKWSLFNFYEENIYQSCGHCAFCNGIFSFTLGSFIKFVQCSSML